MSIPPTFLGIRNCWPHAGHFFLVYSVMLLEVYRVSGNCEKMGPDPDFSSGLVLAAQGPITCGNP